MRCSILVIGFLATVTSTAPAGQDVPLDQHPGTLKLDLPFSISTCSSRNPFTPAKSLPSSLLSSRSVPAVRWTTPGAPGIALRILAQNIVADPVRLGAFLFAVHTRMARLNNQIQAQPLPQGFTAQEGGPTASHFMFTICPYAPGNQALTLEMAHRVAFSLSQFMASGGGYRLLQYDAFTEGLTPADDVQFASGTIAMVFVAPLHVPAIVAPQAQGFPVELMGGGRG